MRYNTGGFNAPSREAIYKKIMKFSEGDAWTYDYETFVAFDGLWVWRETFRKGGGITFIVKVHSRIVHKIGLVVSTFIPPSAETAIGRKASRSLFHCYSA